jgi:hypothetical protein
MASVRVTPGQKYIIEKLAELEERVAALEFKAKQLDTDVRHASEPSLQEPLRYWNP